MKRVLLVAFLALHTLLAFAQGIVRGVVVDKSENVRLPGVYVSVRGASSGVHTNADGSFQLLIPADTATLRFSSIGYRMKERRVEAGDSMRVSMNIDAILDYFYQRYAGVALSGAAPHTPLGGHLTLFQPYLLQTMSMQPAARVELEYRSGRTARYQALTLALDELVATYDWNVDVALHLQRVQLRNWQFDRRSLGANVTYGRNRLPLWLAAGHMQLRTESQQYRRTGLEVGSEYNLTVNRKYRYTITSRLTWWQTVWQWQNSVALDHWHYIVAATYQRIGKQYAEVGLQLGVKLMVRKPSKPAAE